MGRLEDIEFAKKVEKKIQSDLKKEESDEARDNIEAYRIVDRLNKTRKELGIKETYGFENEIPKNNKSFFSRFKRKPKVKFSKDTVNTLTALEVQLNDGSPRRKKGRWFRL